MKKFKLHKNVYVVTNIPEILEKSAIGNFSDELEAQKIIRVFKENLSTRFYIDCKMPKNNVTEVMRELKARLKLDKRALFLSIIRQDDFYKNDSEIVYYGVR